MKIQMFDLVDLVSLITCLLQHVVSVVLSGTFFLVPLLCGFKDTVYQFDF